MLVSRSEIAQLLRKCADDVCEFMQSPVYLGETFAISEDTDLSLLFEPNLLGDKYCQFIQPLLRNIRTKCLVSGSGLGEISIAIENSSRAAVDYLNALSDHLNASVPQDAWPMHVVPQIESLGYTFGRHTPVDGLIVLLQDLANELAGPDCVVTQESLAAAVGCTGRLVRIALERCPSVSKGTRGRPKSWNYSQAVEHLKNAESPDIRNFPWPATWPEFGMGRSGKIPERK